MMIDEAMGRLLAR